MPFEFQTQLYRTADEMCRAIASTWLSCGGGFTGRKLMLDFFTDSTAEELADDAFEGLGLDCREGHASNPEPCTWMEDRGITRENIVAAFARIRKDLDEREP